MSSHVFLNNLLLTKNKIKLTIRDQEYIIMQETEKL